MKAPRTLPDLDRDIYDLLAASAAAGIPIAFCGSDATRKWELLATLRKLLRRHEVDASEVLNARETFTVTPDQA